MPYYPVATNSNVTNSQGRALATLKARTSVFISTSVPANSTLNLPASGTQFYLTTTSAPISIRPDTGIGNLYSQGTGMQLDLVNAFSILEITNDNSFSVSFQLFVGFDQFIDKRLFLLNNQQPQVVYPTYPVSNAANVINIPDLSGQPFADINGNSWLAVSRSAIIVCNTDNGVTLLLQQSGASTSNAPAIAAIYPGTSLNYPCSGDYTISTGGGNINAIVSEIYSAIASTT